MAAPDDAAAECERLLHRELRRLVVETRQFAEETEKSAAAFPRLLSLSDDAQILLKALRLESERIRNELARSAESSRVAITYSTVSRLAAQTFMKRNTQ